jgi:hypothetical protein
MTDDVFTPEQVVRLWQWQFGPWRAPFDAITEENKDLPVHMHPFTCANREGHPLMAGDNGVLVPTVRGWICPFCSYTQTWAHDFMMKTTTRER